MKSIDSALQRARGKLERPVDVSGRRHAGVYVARRDTPGLGCATVEEAIAAARGMLGEEYLDATGRVVHPAGVRARWA